MLRHPLRHIRSAHVLNIAQNLRRYQAGAAIPGAAGAGAFERPRIRQIRGACLVAGDKQVAPGLVAGHIKRWVGGVLHIENTAARANRPAVARTVGQTQARREVVVIGIDQAAAHELVAGLGALPVGEVKVQALVEVAAAWAGEDGRRRVGNDAVGSDARAEQLDIHDAPILVIPGTAVFVAQAHVQGQPRGDLPIVLNVGVVGAPAQQRIGHGRHTRGLRRQAQHVVGEDEAGGVAICGIEGGLAVEQKLARDLGIAELVVAVPADLASKLHGVAAFDQGELSMNWKVSSRAIHGVTPPKLLMPCPGRWPARHRRADWAKTGR